MSRFINLTPHNISIITEEGEKLDVPASGRVARVSTSEAEENALPSEAGLIRVFAVAYGEVEGLPGPQADAVYLVSRLVLDAVDDREDVFAPDTGPTAVRDQDGRITGVTRLISSC